MLILDGVLERVPRDFKGEFVVGEEVTRNGSETFKVCSDPTGVTIFHILANSNSKRVSEPVPLTHIDEAHRTQYKQLAENMHTGLPNANYIAFTGTPLLGSKRLTNQWFGDVD